MHSWRLQCNRSAILLNKISLILCNDTTLSLLIILSSSENIASSPLNTKWILYVQSHRLGQVHAEAQNLFLSLFQVCIKKNLLFTSFSFNMTGCWLKVKARQTWNNWSVESDKMVLCHFCYHSPVLLGITKLIELYQEPHGTNYREVIVLRINCLRKSTDASLLLNHNQMQISINASSMSLWVWPAEPRACIDSKMSQLK